MKKSILFFVMGLLIYACGGGNNSDQQQASEPVDDGKGYGEITEVTLNDPLNQTMVERGKAIYEMKCACQFT